jgi:hypothetical protein
MDRGRHSSVSILRAKFARTLFLSGLLFACADSSAWAQYDPRGPGYIDPEQRAIAAKRERLAQDAKNIAIQQMGLAEVESRARTIRRQLEALALMPEGEVSSRLAAYAAEMSAERNALECRIETTKRFMAADTQILDATRSQLNAQEEQYKKRMAAAHPHQVAKFSSDDYTEKIRQQNARLCEEAAQRQNLVERQNQRLMQEVEPPPRPGQGLPGISLALTGNPLDQEDWRRCELLEKKVAEKDYDIAEINLLTAKGLPGAENLDVERSLKTLDLWAAWVKHETDRHLHKFRKTPEEFNNSEAYFRILMMICTLQEDFHVCYNKDPKMQAGPVELVPSDFTFFGKPKDLFVHGLTEGEHEGTCASLPVLYVAIGRRLGYPLKLVECKGHLFVRWEDTKERFNIEGTSRGLNCYPDEEYMEWPWPISKEELKTGMYMKSLSPKRELAAFLELRSLCLKQHGREEQHLVTKRFADVLRKKEGVDLDGLNQIMRGYVRMSSRDGTVGSAVLYQTLTNTNSWRAPGDERGAPGKHTVFATERSNPK